MTFLQPLLPSFRLPWPAPPGAGQFFVLPGSFPTASGRAAGGVWPRGGDAETGRFGRGDGGDQSLKGATHAPRDDPRLGTRDRLGDLADAVVNTGYELSQPHADGSRPVTVSSARSDDTFPTVRMGVAPDLITEGPDADGRGTLIVRPGRSVMFLR